MIAAGKVGCTPLFGQFSDAFKVVPVAVLSSRILL
jgi:hypothetical protein